MVFYEVEPLEGDYVDEKGKYQISGELELFGATSFNVVLFGTASVAIVGVTFCDHDGL